jgi:hypothetical protein
VWLIWWSFSSLNDVLVAFDFLRFVSVGMPALNALPRISAQQRRFTLGCIAVDWLSQAALFAGHDEIPHEGLAVR